jgi:hypothetical protein
MLIAAEKKHFEKQSQVAGKNKARRPRRQTG